MNPDEMSSKIIEHGEDIRELRTRVSIMTDAQKDILEKLGRLADQWITECRKICDTLVSTTTQLDGVVQRVDAFEKRLADGDKRFADGDKKIKEIANDVGFSAWAMKGLRKVKDQSAYIFIVGGLGWLLWLASQWGLLKIKLGAFLK